jgi:polysaccharide biosynthesis PFTS motif protein
MVLFGNLRRKSSPPSAIIFSLTVDQVFKNTNIKDLLGSLREERFANYYDVKDLLVEVKSIRLFFNRHTNFTIDAASSMVINCLKTDRYPSLLREFFKNISGFKHRDYKNFTGLKKALLDKSIWKIFSETMDLSLDLVTTCSSLTTLPPAIESELKGRRIMLWYSTNFKIIEHKEVEITTEWDPRYIENFIDMHLVWTKYDVNYMSLIQLDPSISVGSIVFQPKVVVPKEMDSFVVTFFDITPITSDRERALGIEHNFVSEEKMLSDLRSFLDSAQKLRDRYGNVVKFRIKPKRSYHKTHSKRYIAELKEANRKKIVELMSPHSNIYQAVNESDLVIAIPWSAPAILAQESFTNSFYLATKRFEWKIPQEYNGIKVITSKDQLKRNLIILIDEKLNRMR